MGDLEEAVQGDILLDLWDPITPAALPHHRRRSLKLETRRQLIELLHRLAFEI